jgi:hypothetical protein
VVSIGVSVTTSFTLLSLVRLPTDIHTDVEEEVLHIPDHARVIRPSSTSVFPENRNQNCVAESSL